MLKLDRILCPTDFSEASAIALEYAESFARRYGSELFVEHVIEPFGAAYGYYSFAEALKDIRDGLRSEARAHLERFVLTHCHGDLLPEIIVEDGSPTEGILACVEQKDIDLIVMGTHGRHGVDRLLLGSVTEKILRKSRCPVLAVRKPLHMASGESGGAAPIELRRIVFCTDFSESSLQALAYALSLAMEFNAELTMIHVLESVPQGTDVRHATELAMGRICAVIPPDADDWCRIKTVVRLGKPYQEIVQLSLEAQADLVVMGVRGRNILDLAVFGSTTHRVIQLGSCPVLAVHSN